MNVTGVTVEPKYTGSLKILTGRGLMSILMAYYTKPLHARKQQNNQHSFKRSILQTKVGANLLRNGIIYVTLCTSTVQ